MMMGKSAIAICRDENILASSEVVLVQAGYGLHRTSQTKTILKTLSALKPDLIILDLDLPGGNAADVLHWIGYQHLRPALVLVSSGESLRLLREGFVVPDFQLLIKPLGKDEMKEAVSCATRSTRRVLLSGT